MVRGFLQFGVVAAALVSGCNPLFGIHQGKPRPICADTNPEEALIDDMEDGDGFICDLEGRNGHWFTVGDGTSPHPTPGPNLDPTRIVDGGRGTSQYAAHFTGAGFTLWGAMMGFDFKAEGQGTQPINASNADGIRFWMKSNVPVSVKFPIPETTSLTNGGACADSATDRHCDNDFSFQITAPSPDWFEYTVPFDSLSQYGATTTLNPQLLLRILFVVPPGAGAFDVWVDDIRFYYCPSCTPTCTDPAFSVPCPASDRHPSACLPPGTDCALVATWCADLSLLDDMEDGDSAICDSGGRRGWWYAVGGSTSPDLSPPAMGFVQATIPGGRGTSRHAARLTDSDFTDWAVMGFSLNAQAEGNLSYDASRWGGITFWMKSNVPVLVKLPTSETFQPTCTDNCDNPFSFQITAPSNDWAPYNVPFSALGQQFFDRPGPATWNPAHLVAIEFQPPNDSTFEVWVDDVAFYDCSGSGCLPTCTDQALAVQCPASGGYPSRCWPQGTDCVVGCNASNTFFPSRDAPIATFTGGVGGADIKGQLFAYGDPAPITTITDGKLHITQNAPPATMFQASLVVDHFENCAHATGATGVQFSISGSFSGSCTLLYFTEDSAHLYDGGIPASSGSHGTGPIASHPMSARLTAAQITSAPQTVMIPFTDLVNGFPAAPFDKTKITGVGWAFIVDPLAGEGSTSCVADLTIDDVRFY